VLTGAASLLRGRGRVAQRWRKPLAVGLSLLGLGLFATILVAALWMEQYKWVAGVDRALYRDAALRWLDDGLWYRAEQVAGPYEIVMGHILYPPTALVLWFVPAAFLPDALWWAIPLTVTAAVIWQHRPAPWSWPLMAACLAFPWSAVLVASGNPTIWIAMFIAVGTLWRPAFALVLLKPSLFPFAFLGMRSRGWWFAVAGIAVLSLAMLPMWVDYIRVLVNARGSMASIWYSARDVPLLVMPLVAWAASRRHPVRPGKPAETLQPPASHSIGA
jgi:hypothetical protein